MSIITVALAYIAYCASGVFVVVPGVWAIVSLLARLTGRG